MALSPDIFKNVAGIQCTRLALPQSLNHDYGEYTLFALAPTKGYLADPELQNDLFAEAAHAAKVERWHRAEIKRTGDYSTRGHQKYAFLVKDAPLDPTNPSIFNANVSRQRVQLFPAQPLVEDLQEYVATAMKGKPPKDSPWAGYWGLMDYLPPAKMAELAEFARKQNNPARRAWAALNSWLPGPSTRPYTV